MTSYMVFTELGTVIYVGVALDRRPLRVSATLTSRSGLVLQRAENGARQSRLRKP